MHVDEQATLIGRINVGRAHGVDAHAAYGIFGNSDSPTLGQCLSSLPTGVACRRNQLDPFLIFGLAARLASYAVQLVRPYPPCQQ